MTGRMWKALCLDEKALGAVNVEGKAVPKNSHPSSTSFLPIPQTLSLPREHYTPQNLPMTLRPFHPEPFQPLPLRPPLSIPPHNREIGYHLPRRDRAHGANLAILPPPQNRISISTPTLPPTLPTPTNPLKTPPTQPLPPPPQTKEPFQ